jgi:hypothetical protein
MFVNEFIFSFLLLSFAGLLCLSGLVILIDGIKRLIAEWYEGREPAVASEREQKEPASTPQRAA